MCWTFLEGADPSKLEVAHRRDLHLADDLELRVAVLDLELHVEHANRILETGQFIGITKVSQPEILKSYVLQTCQYSF